MTTADPVGGERGRPAAALPEERPQTVLQDPAEARLDALDADPLRCFDPATSERMVAEVDEAFCLRPEFLRG